MIKVKLFAFLREQFGREELLVDAAGKSVEELKQELTTTLQGTNLDHVMVAINEEFVPNDTVIAEGDVVAFIPPVSGG